MWHFNEMTCKESVLCSAIGTDTQTSEKAKQEKQKNKKAINS